MAYWISSYRASSSSTITTTNVLHHDFSSLFLFEASGDSEFIVSDSDPNAHSEDFDDDREGDDAESFSWDSSFDHDRILGGDDLDDLGKIGGDDEQRESTVFVGSGDYRDLCCDRMSWRSGFTRSSSSSSVCLMNQVIEGADDQDLKRRHDRAVLMDRMDHDEDDDHQNRLFWETCLEVGYP